MATSAQADGRLPIGVCLRSIRAEPGWWLESARRLDAAGYAGVWSWDHFMGRGDPTVPVVEAWTILSMAAAQTSRVTVGPFVLNVMNRHPALVARMASTLQIASGGRLILGIGIGGAPKEHAAYGMDFPPAPERVARLEEAVAVIRALWTGGPVTRPSPFYPLPEPSPSRSRTRRRRSSSAARPRPGRGWPDGSATAGRRSTTTSSRTCRSTSSRSRRPGSDARTSRSSSGSRATGWATRAIRDTPWIEAPRETWERWQAAGADGAIVLARTTADVDALVEAPSRW